MVRLILESVVSREFELFMEGLSRRHFLNDCVLPSVSFPRLMIS